MSRKDGFTLKAGEIVRYPKGTARLVIPDGVRELTSCFAYDDYIQEIVIPPSVTKIGKSAFRDCDGLERITIPGTVQIIEDHAFECCAYLDSITIEEGVRSIGNQAFDCCPISHLSLPSTLTHVGCGAFGDYPTVTDEHGLQILDGILIRAPRSLKGSFEIPDGIRVIADNAFSDCVDLTQITIPDHIISLAEYAFSDCTSLQTVKLPKNLQLIGEGAFQGCSKLTNIEIPDGTTEIGSRAFSGCSSLSEISIPDSTTKIGSCAFSDCSSLSELNIPAGVTEIGDLAFSGCIGLSEIDIPDSVTETGEYAFADCSKLNRISLPSKITRIESGLFEGCTGLISADIPKGVTEIALTAFKGCTALQKITLPEALHEIGEQAFSGCTELTHVRVPKSVTDISCHAFDGCGAVAETDDGMFLLGAVLIRYQGSGVDVTVPDGITMIANGAFYACKALRSIRLPDSVTTLGSSAFWGCKNLEHVVLPASLSAIQHGTFASCEALAEVHLPDSLHSLDAKAFTGCRRLQTITLPPHLESIGEEAFTDCTGLTTVRFTGGKPELQAQAFSSCKSLQKVVLPDQIGTIDKTAFAGCGKLTFEVLDTLAQQEQPLPPILCAHTIWVSDRGRLHLALFQHNTAWENWSRQCVTADPAQQLEQMIDLIGQKKLAGKKTAAYTAWFVNQHYSALDPERIRTLLAYYQGVNSVDIDDLFKNQQLADYLSQGDAANRPSVSDPNAELETLARAKLTQLPPDQETVQAVKKGIHWKDSSQICSKEVLICLLNWSVQEWKRCAVEVQGEMNTRTVLYDGTKVRIDTEIDAIAAALEHSELMELLTKLIGGTKYRLFLLAWTHFADETEMSARTESLNDMLRGPSKGRYFAQNFIGAMMTSNTVAAMRFFESKYHLEEYAQYHGTSAELLRDTKLIPDTDFAVDAAPRYDIGGKTICVQVSAGPTFCLYDESAGKQVRSIPQKGADPDKAAAAAEAFAAFKKKYTDYYKNRALRLKKLNLSGAAVSPEIWKNVYWNDAAMRLAMAGIVWMDEAGQTFHVRSEGAVNAELQPYTPQGAVHIAHTLELPEASIAAWQQALSWESGGSNPDFTLIWEPAFHAGTSSLPMAFDGIVITNEEWNAFVRNLRQRGMYVRSKYAEMDLDALPPGTSLSADSTIYLGDSVHLDHSPAGYNRVMLGKMELCENAGEREVNAVLTEICASVIRSAIASRKPELLRTEYLKAFYPGQIRAFTEMAINANSTACAAVLMNCQNERISDQEGAMP